MPRPASVAPDAEALVAGRDIVITITSATAPLFDGESVRPGTQFACMGSDTVGKREAPDGLLRRARIFTDDIDQALTLGECQHGTDRAAITPLAHVVAGIAAGRSTDTDITLYDGTGLGLQDLVMANMLVRIAGNRALHIPF